MPRRIQLAYIFYAEYRRLSRHFFFFLLSLFSCCRCHDYDDFRQAPLPLRCQPLFCRRCHALLPLISFDADFADDAADVFIFAFRCRFFRPPLMLFACFFCRRRQLAAFRCQIRRRR